MKRKLLSILLALALCLGMCPAAVLAADGNGTSVTLDTSSAHAVWKSWESQNYNVFIYYWGSDKTDGFVRMNKQADSLYKAVVPAGYTDILFCLCPDQEANWDYISNKTGNQTISVGKENTFVITDVDNENSPAGMTCYVCFKAAAKVQTAGNAAAYYDTLEKAWAAARGNTATVTLLADAEITETLQVGSSDNITLTSDGDHTILCEKLEAIRITTGGSLTIAGGTVKSTALRGQYFAGYPTISVSTDIGSPPRLTISGNAKVISEYNDAIEANNICEVSIEGGTISGYSGISFNGNDRGNLTIRGGTITGTKAAALEVGSNAKIVKLSGGTFAGVGSAIQTAPPTGGTTLTLGELLTKDASTHYAYFDKSGNAVLDVLDERAMERYPTVTVKACRHDSHNCEYQQIDGATHSKTCRACGYTNASEACTYQFKNNAAACLCGSEIEVTVTGVEGLVYTGSAHSPAVTVGDLVKDTDYEVTYSNNINAGTAKVIVKGTDKGNCTGSLEKTFTIAKAMPTLNAAPTAAAIQYGQKLSDSTLTGGKAVNGSLDVAGTWSWASADTQPTASGSFAAAFTPTDTANYNPSASVNVNVAVNPAAPKITITAPSHQSAGQDVEVTYTVENPHDAAKDDLPAATLTYKIGDGEAQALTGGKFTIPAGTAADTDITITAKTEAVDGKYSPATQTATVTVTAKPSSVGPGGSSGGTSAPPVATDTTDTTAKPTATTQNGTATTTVSSSMGAEIVKQATENQSENVVITPQITGNVTKTEVSIPASTVGQIGSQTTASLTISTPVAYVTIPNGGLGTLSSAGGTVTVTAEQTGSTVEFIVTAGGKKVESIPGGVTLTVPAKSATPGTVAVLVKEDGTREVVRKSVADEDSVTIPLDGSAKLEIVDNTKSFSDVPSTSWAADAVAFAGAHELFNGTAPNTFSPSQSMSRGMLAVVLHNLENNPGQPLTGIFGDVGSDTWYAEGVAWAAENGIVAGVGNGYFAPNSPITREQLATMLWRYAGEPEAKQATLGFADSAKVSEYAFSALCWATEQGIVNGKGGDILDPLGTATRAEVAQMLMNYLNK